MEEVLYYGLVGAAIGVMWWQNRRRARGGDESQRWIGEEANQVIELARHEAERQGQRLNTWHLLYALLFDHAISAAIERCGRDPKEVQARTLGALMNIKAPPPGKLKRVLYAAARIAMGHRRKVVPLDIWYGLFREARAPLWFGAAGIDGYDVFFAACHPAGAADSPGDAVELEVFMVNDDYSEMQFVVELLQELFELSPEVATRMMLTIHGHERATIGTFPSATAVELVAQARERARQAGYPLRIDHRAWEPDSLLALPGDAPPPQD